MAVFVAGLVMKELQNWVASGPRSLSSAATSPRTPRRQSNRAWTDAHRLPKETSARMLTVGRIVSDLLWTGSVE